MDNFHKPTYVDLLPLELLLSILAHIPTCQNILNTSSPAWALSQTSSILRSACLASPNLWSTITVDPPAAYPISQIRYLLPLALQRSQPLGVKIRLINQEGRLNSAFRVALDILLEHSSRWADVEFVNLEEPALGLSLPGTLGFSSMKSLAFSTHHPSLVARHLLYGLLHGSRDLDSLGLYLEFRSPPFFELITSMEIGRWQRLLELRLRIPSDWRIPELLTVLTLTSNVRRFSVSDYGVRRSELIDGLPILPPGLWLPGLTVQPLNGTENGSGAGHILLEHLSNLEIYAKSVWTFTAVLSNISVPNLDSLSLYLPRQVNAIDLLDPLAQLLRHSGLNNQSGGLGTKGIRRLHLSSARASNLDALLGVLGTHIEELVVSGIHELGEGTKVFNMLTIPTNLPEATTTVTDITNASPLHAMSNARLPWLCPVLTNLSAPFPHIERSAISALLLARSMAGPSRLNMGALPVSRISLLATSFTLEDRRMVNEKWVSDGLVDEVKWLGWRDVVESCEGRLGRLETRRIGGLPVSGSLGTW